MTVVKKARKPRKRMTAEQKKAAQLKREQARFVNSVHEIFTKAGFRKVSTNGVEIRFETDSGQRTSELDGLYAHENILVIVEDTCAKKPNDHLANKMIISNLIKSGPSGIIKSLESSIPSFKDYYDEQTYQATDYIIKYLYFSMYPVGDEHVERAKDAGIVVVPRSLANYFTALSKTISSSAKYELIKFLDIPYKDIGAAKISGGGAKKEAVYTGFLLPENNSTYPKGYKIISFYADPKSLIEKSYVLRKNSWNDPSKSYQRIIDTKKIKQMRKYLCEEERVYVNNIIATLPGSTSIQDYEDEGNTRRSQLNGDELNNLKPVCISLPDEFSVVGLIDGQHRVFSYHEGTDEAEKKIKKLRERQNLLVTGIIYPDNITDEQRVLFEARLFLEINDRQLKVRSALTQEIELIVNPYSTTAISRHLISKFSKNGALKGLLETDIFDSEKKLKIASIVSYGLKPLVKREGRDSLYEAWSDEKSKLEISEKKEDQVALLKYIEFCYTEINKILHAAKMSAPENWSIDHESKMLTPTSVNGLIRCLRIILENKKNRTQDEYLERLKNFSDFDFENYKSSHWNMMGIAIYNQFFEDDPGA